jgi:uncharacterized membrane protein
VVFTAKYRLNQTFPFIVLACGIIGLIASLILVHDTLAVSQNAHYVPSCNLNPVLSCGNVINAPGDKILGLPYPYYGIAAFSILIGSGAGMLAGAKYKKWYWLTFQVLMTIGTVGAYLLLLKSIYKIHSLCPFCLSVDVATTILFWYTTLYVFGLQDIRVRNAKLNAVYFWVRRHHLDILILWFLLVIAFILKHFWYYYGKHL